MRTCTRCGIEKPIEEFGFKYRERGIRQSWCKPCYVEYKRVWYLENREKHIAHVRMLRDQHSAENQLRMWQYLAAHPCVDCGERDPVVLRSSSGQAHGRLVHDVERLQVGHDPRRDREVRNPLRQLSYDEDGEGARYLGTKAHDIAHAICF